MADFIFTILMFCNSHYEGNNISIRSEVYYKACIDQKSECLKRPDFDRCMEERLK